MSRIRKFPWYLGLVLVVLLAYSTIGAPNASGEESNGTKCNEFTNSLGTFHSFGGGACYEGAPNSAHANNQVGYCHQYHYSCS